MPGGRPQEHPRVLRPLGHWGALRVWRLQSLWREPRPHPTCTLLIGVKPQLRPVRAQAS